MEEGEEHCRLNFTGRSLEHIHSTAISAEEGREEKRRKRKEGNVKGHMVE